MKYLTRLAVLIIILLTGLSVCGEQSASWPERHSSQPPIHADAVPFGPLSAGSTASQLAAAILTPDTASFLVSSSLSGSNVQAEVLTDSLQGFPILGNSYALLSTGIAADTPGSAGDFMSVDVGGPFISGGSPEGYQAYDVVTLTLRLNLPSNAENLTFSFKFGTEENPDYLNSPYQDFFTATLRDSSGNAIAQIARLPNNRIVTVDNAAVYSNAVGGWSESPTPPFPSPNDTVYNAVTSNVLTASCDITSFAGSTISIVFQLGDASDQVYDSVVFIDKLRVTTTGGEVERKVDLFVLPGSVHVTRRDPKETSVPQANQLLVWGVVGNAGPHGTNEAEVTLYNVTQGKIINSPQKLKLDAGGRRVVSFTWELDKNITKLTTLRIEILALDAQEEVKLRTDNSEECEAIQYWFLGGGGSGRETFSLEKDAYGFENYGLIPKEEDVMKAFIKKDLALDWCTLTSPKAAFTTLMGNIAGIIGHCYGMASSSLLYWEDPKLKPKAGNVYNYTVGNQAVINAMNRFHAYQLEWLAVIFSEAFSGDRFNNEAQYLLSNDKGYLCTLGAPGQRHAVAAYALLRRGNTSFIYIYDPNNPYPGIFSHCEYIKCTPQCIKGIRYLGVVPTPWQYKDISVNKWQLTDEIYTDFGEFRGWYPSYDALSDRIARPSICEFFRDKVWNPVKDTLGKWWKKLTVGSPIEVVVVDSSGRRTGIINGSEINEIPDAQIEYGLGVVSYYLPWDADYTVTVSAIDAGTAQLVFYIPTETGLHVDHFDCQVSPGATGHIVLPQESLSLQLSIDDDGDGQPDRVVVPTTFFPVGQEYWLGSDLAESVVNHGPNPVPSQGCVFWLNLPDDTSSATVKIFDIDGAGLLDIPVDPTVNRYPQTGRWLPQDEQGRLLGTGLYLYVVEIKHTDGTTTYSPVQKMVIQQ